MNLPTTQELVEQELLSNYASMYRLAYTYVKNESDAMDIVQESAYLAIKHAATVKHVDYIRTWIFRIVINTALSALRRNSFEVAAEKIAEQGQNDQYTDFDMMEALNVLNDKERTVIILRYFEDCRLQDIADAMKENLNTVKSILYRSLKKLRIELTEGEICHET
ncbi:sigma-70 family RNA polymerase sigma factor [Lachnospiraceae bacterium]|nr:sigma-70 family RNA polymerase sigma factor [Lachnospiraceae bacterium]